MSNILSFVFCFLYFISGYSISFFYFYWLVSKQKSNAETVSSVHVINSTTPSFLVHLYTIQFMYMYQWICRAGVKTNNCEILHYMYMYVEKKIPQLHIVYIYIIILLRFDLFNINKNWFLFHKCILYRWYMHLCMYNYGINV